MLRCWSIRGRRFGSPSIPSSCRHKSIGSAISGALRKTAQPRRWGEQSDDWRRESNARFQGRVLRQTSRRKDVPGDGYPRPPSNPNEKLESRARSQYSSFGKEDRKTPRSSSENSIVTLPYTTAASEFLYGTSVVKAALNAARRKFYKLYIYKGANRATENEDFGLRRLALDRGVLVEHVGQERLRVLDKMSQGRPHNGYILEASRLPAMPVKGLMASPTPSKRLHLILDHQSKEEADVNGTETEIYCHMRKPRYPFVLLLDGLLDGGNLGGILRSAHFFGVDAVAISHHCASITPNVLKASAGASESMTLLRVAQPNTFLHACQTNGWKVYAADAPGPGTSTMKNKSFLLHHLSRSPPLLEHPSILIMGGEGEGIRRNLQKMANYNIGIDGSRLGHDGVDSLNVSVATALLVQAFMNTYALQDERKDKSNRLF